MPAARPGSLAVSVPFSSTLFCPLQRGASGQPPLQVTWEGSPNLCLTCAWGSLIKDAPCTPSLFSLVIHLR